MPFFNAGTAQYDSTGVENTIVVFNANKAITDIGLIIIAVLFMIGMYKLLKNTEVELERK